MIGSCSPKEPRRGYGPCAIYGVMSQFMYKAHDARAESVSTPIPQTNAIEERSIRYHFFSGCGSESIVSLSRLQLFWLLLLYFSPFVTEGDGSVEGEDAIICDGSDHAAVGAAVAELQCSRIDGRSTGVRIIRDDSDGGRTAQSILARRESDDLVLAERKSPALCGRPTGVL